MDKSINKRLSHLGVSNEEIVEEKLVETHVDKMTPVEMLQALKKRYIDRKSEVDEHVDFLDIASNWGIRIETVDQCINLISNNKEREEMLRAIKYLFSFVRDWEGEIPKGLDPTFYVTGDYEEDVKIKNKIDKMKNKWGKEMEDFDGI